MDVAIVLAVLIFTYVIAIYNRMQTLWQGVREGLANVEMEAGTLADLSKQYFRAERLDISGSAELLDAGFSVLVVIDGTGTLTPANAPATPLAKGDTVAVPFAAGDLEVNGNLSVVRCRPPQP